MALMKKINSGEEVRKKEPSNTIGGNVNYIMHYFHNGGQYGGSSKH
jgi:hypothetical protein